MRADGQELDLRPTASGQGRVGVHSPYADYAMKRRYLTFRAAASILKSFAGGGSSDRMTRKALTSRL
jgi:hypothetical protein